MNADVKAKWVAALRSGEYEQGRTRLCDLDCRMCCLGVLTDLYRKEFGGEWVPVEDGKLYLDEGVFLPREVAVWAGLRFNPYIGTQSASVLNDELNKSFSEIADLIEARL